MQPDQKEESIDPTMPSTALRSQETVQLHMQEEEPNICRQFSYTDIKEDCELDDNNNIQVGGAYQQRENVQTSKPIAKRRSFKPQRHRSEGAFTGTTIWDNHRQTSRSWDASNSQSALQQTVDAAQTQEQTQPTNGRALSNEIQRNVLLANQHQVNRASSTSANEIQQSVLPANQHQANGAAQQTREWSIASAPAPRFIMNQRSAYYNNRVQANNSKPMSYRIAHPANYTHVPPASLGVNRSQSLPWSHTFGGSMSYEQPPNFSLQYAAQQPPLVHFGESGLVTPAEPSLGLIRDSTDKKLSHVDEESGSDDDPNETHPNKFPIAIEEHTHRECCYRRQPSRSGPQVKVVKRGGDVYSPTSPTGLAEVGQEQMRKFYRKDLVRKCVCGRYETKEALLTNRGRDNDADGYEVHYNIKCRWKSFEDFKTKQRVLIRLCKCYKPSF